MTFFIKSDYRLQMTTTIYCAFVSPKRAHFGHCRSLAYLCHEARFIQRATSSSSMHLSCVIWSEKCPKQRLKHTRISVVCFQGNILDRFQCGAGQKKNVFKVGKSHCANLKIVSLFSTKKKADIPVSLYPCIPYSEADDTEAAKEQAEPLEIVQSIE